MTSSATPKSAGIVRFAIILGALTALGPLANDAYMPGLPQIAEDLNTSASAAQLSLTACLLGLGIGQLIAGPVSDALGRRRPLIAGLALFAVTALLCAFAPNIWTLVGLRALQGLGGATGIVIASAVVRDRHTGPAAARFFAMLMLITGIAPILAPILGGQLMLVTSWKGIFVALAIIGALMLFGVAGALPETHPAERRVRGGLKATGPIFRRLLGDKVFVGYNLACGFAFAAMFAYISGSTFVLQSIHGMSPQGYSVVFGVNALGLVIAAQVSGRIVHKTGPRALLATGLAVSAVGGLGLLAVVLTDAGLAPLLVALFLVVSSVGLVLPNSFALALQDHGDVAGSAAALLGLSQHLIGAAVVPLVGLAGEDSAVPMGIVIAVLGVGGLLFFGLTKGHKAAGEEAGAQESADQAPAARTAEVHEPV
ncbi:multidrug effflux MFS transporter [Streptomyces sp. ZAF1911]|uniref:multidrug effflux MFS transporter n=1 Tax=unclassified Streptomyces TaxID=2593676 RepID=UPI00237B8058|nr:multidrug effflux MFS transporter [Streptomyces sp. ZAF1911]MDD9383034.1 multidrug effflux MFS transporter [Streptomyces sp. ZAF1911]